MASHDERGQALAKRNPTLKKQLDAAKLTINDAVFEVLEAVSGKSVAQLSSAWVGAGELRLCILGR